MGAGCGGLRLSVVPGRIGSARTGRGGRGALDRAGISTLGGLGNVLTRLGPGPAGPGRDGKDPDTPWNSCLAGHWGGAGRPLLLHPASRSLCRLGPSGRRPPGAGRGPHPGRAARGSLVGSRNRSPARCLAPTAAGDTTGGGGSLVAARPGRRPSPGGEIAGAAGCHEPGTPVAATGQAPGSTRPAGADLRLVYRGL